MKRTSISSLLGAVGIVFLVGAGAFWLGRARADGVPAPETLYYSGTLDDGASPANGMRTIQIGLWDGLTGATRHCLTSANVMVTAGRFRFPLDPACTMEIKANPDLYLEPIVGDVTLPRRKVGAVPYAIEAARASEASGALKDQLARLGAMSPGGGPPRSGFSAYKTLNQTLTEGDCALIAFQVEEFDFGDEFDIASNKFTAKESGYYQATCSIMFQAPDKGVLSALHVVAVVKNGTCTTDVQVVSNSFYGDSFQAAVLATRLVKLNANEFLTCVGYQDLSGGPRVVTASAQFFQARNFFSVVRVF